MTFLAPLGLLALLTLPLIVLLHLRRERLRRVAVPSLMLWQYIAPETGKRRKFMLPFTLLLLLHLLIAALLALALSQPQWLGRLLGSDQQHLIVIVDSSTSMAAREGMGQTRLDQARDHVRGLIDQLGGSGTLSIIEAGSEAHLLTSGGAGNRAGLITALDQMQPTGTGTDLVGALTLADIARANVPEQQAASGEQLVVVSDLEPPTDAGLPLDQIEWERVGGNSDNRAIVVMAARARQNNSAEYDVYTRITNYHDQPVTTALRLFADDELLNVHTVDLQASGEAELTWELPSNVEVLRAELESDDALPIDNTAVLSLAQSRTISTLLVAEEAGPLQRALEAIPDLNVTTRTPAEYFSAPQAAELTVFQGVLPDEWPVGGVLVINPPAGNHSLLTVDAAPPAESAEAAPFPPYVSLSTTEAADDMLEDLNLESIDFAFDSLPVVQLPDWANVLLVAERRARLADGTLEDAVTSRPLILRGNTGESEIAIWTFDPSQGNLAGKLVFPLLVARTVENLTTPPSPQSVLLGETLVMQAHPRAERARLLTPAGETRDIAIATTFLIDGLTEPGLYTLEELDSDGVISQSQIAVNAGSPLESDLRPRPMPQTEDVYLAGSVLEATPDNSENTPTSTPEPLWPLLSLGAIVILIVEWVYIHWR